MPASDRGGLRRSSEAPLAILLDILDSLSYEGLGATVQRALQNRSDRELLGEMIARLDSPDNFIREVACSVLGRSGNLAASEHLLRMIDDAHYGVRRAAVFALGELKDPDAIPVLERQLSQQRSDDINVVMALEWALRNLGALEETDRVSTNAASENSGEN